VGDALTITGCVKDTKMRARLDAHVELVSRRFTTTLEFKKEIIGSKHRFDAHGRVEVILFTDAKVMEDWQWKAHFITTKCTACTICERVCPTNAITSGERFYIDPDLCINCSVCGVYCPFDAIDDNREVVVPKLTPKEVPKAVVHEELCTGCEFCVDVCPFEALEMQMCDDGFNRIAVVIEKNCVSCKLCEQVCIKDAIEVPRNHQFSDIGMSFMNYLNDGH
jgi:ferredoxin